MGENYDSDESSDIGKMLEAAHKKNAKLAAASGKESGSDDDSLSSDDEANDTSRFRTGRLLTGRKRRNGRTPVNERYSEAIHRRRFQKKKVVRSSDDEEDDEIAMEVAKNAATAPQAPPQVHELLDSSDDEDQKQKGQYRPKSLNELASMSGAISQETLQLNQKLQQATAKLVSARYDQVREIEQSATYFAEMECKRREFLKITTPLKTLRLVIAPRFDENAFNSNITLPKQVELNQGLDVKVENMIDDFMRTAKLDINLCTVIMKAGNQVLDPKRQLSKYSFKDGTKIDAIVYLSSIRNRNVAVARAPAAPSLGKPIKLKVRDTKGEQYTMDTHMKEPFQALVDKYRTMKKLSATAKIELNFDGDRLNLKDTPHSLDMEDEDMVDLKVL